LLASRELCAGDVLKGVLLSTGRGDRFAAQRLPGSRVATYSGSEAAEVASSQFSAIVDTNWSTDHPGTGVAPGCRRRIRSCSSRMFRTRISSGSPSGTTSRKVDANPAHRISAIARLFGGARWIRTPGAVRCVRQQKGCRTGWFPLLRSLSSKNVHGIAGRFGIMTRNLCPARLFGGEGWIRTPGPVNCVRH
jgi:hypothetical protein